MSVIRRSAPLAPSTPVGAPALSPTTWKLGQSTALREPDAPVATKRVAPLPPKTLPTVEARLVQTLNDLTWKRLSRVTATRLTVSTMLSPPAALGLIAPLLYGATGPELARVQQALGMADVAPAEFLGAVRGIILRSKVKTSLWSRPDFTIDKDFAERVQRELGTELETITPELAKGRIDSWLFNGTHGRARDLADADVLAKAPLVPASLVALDPLWQTFFKQADTIAEYPFTKADGRTVAVRMMTGEVPCKSVATGDYRAAKIDMEEGISFICVVPAEEVPLEAITRDISSPSGFARFLEQLQPNKGTLYIPKIDIEARANDGPLLGDATRGPYSAIGSRKVELEGVGHEIATMRFSEPGVTIGGGAAAKLWSGKLPEGFVAGPVEILEAARPFLYIVRDDVNGLIIGAGVFEGPPDPPLKLTEERKLDLGEGYVSAASGLVRAGKNFWVAADDENYLASFPVAGGPGKTLKIFKGELPEDPDERKKEKADIESLLLLPRAVTGEPHDLLLGIGSGSKPKRHRGVVVPLDANGEALGKVRHIDWSKLNEELAKTFPKVNIEGAVIIGDRIRLSQRGNGKANISAIVDLDLKEVVAAVLADKDVPASALRGIRRIDLGQERGVPWTVTDLAALPDGRMIFTAAVEDSGTVVGDGAILATGIGVLNRDGTVGSFRRTEPKVKLEGVSIVGIHGGAVDIAVVSDDDDRKIPSRLFTTSVLIS